MKIDIRRALLLSVAALAIFAGTASTAQASSQHVESRSIPAVSTFGCALHFGGGTVNTTIIRNGTTLTVSTANTSVPRTVYFDADTIRALGLYPWRGQVGGIPAGGKADPWTAYGVPNNGTAVFYIKMHDRRGNGDAETCNITS